MARFKQLFGEPADQRVVPAQNPSNDTNKCNQPRPAHVEVSWTGLRVAFFDLTNDGAANPTFQYWMLQPGRQDLVVPGDIHITSPLADAKAAGYLVSGEVFTKDSNPSGDGFVVYGRAQGSADRDVVLELTNWDHCGTNLFN